MRMTLDGGSIMTGRFEIGLTGEGIDVGVIKTTEAGDISTSCGITTDYPATVAATTNSSIDGLGERQTVSVVSTDTLAAAVEITPASLALPR